PQVWYLDLFAGKNDYAAADKGGAAGHKEINRTTLFNSDVDQGLSRIVVRDQLELLRLRNISPAFEGELEIHDSDENRLHLSWKRDGCVATLNADLVGYGFSVTHQGESCAEYVTSYR
ncbi:MAG: glycosidase, partial [Nitrospirota bacterium]